jgi:DNA-binding MarR family transcriptional regulator
VKHSAPPRYSRRPDGPSDVADLLQAVGRQLRRAAGSQLGPLGLTDGQGRVLRVLDQARTPMRMGDLAERLGIVPRSATSVIDVLEEHGFVARRPDPDDRRATLVALTPKGRRVLQSVRARRTAAATKLLERLSPADRAELHRLLRALLVD